MWPRQQKVNYHYYLLTIKQMNRPAIKSMRALTAAINKPNL
jgi:hypothetical protein